MTHLCAPCIAARITWETVHAAELNAAVEAARADFGLPADSPGLATLDISGYLPAPLQPGAGPQAMPQVQQAVTTVNGTDVCAGHVGPALPGQPAARKQLLVANGALSQAMVAGLG